MEGQLTAPGTGRSAPRATLDLHGAQMRELGYSRMPVVIADLSMTGFRTEWPYKLRSDDRVWLTLPGLESRLATVVWAKSFVVGCKFDEPLHPAVFDRLSKP